MQIRSVRNKEEKKKRFLKRPGFVIWWNYTPSIGRIILFTFLEKKVAPVTMNIIFRTNSLSGYFFSTIRIHGEHLNRIVTMKST